MLIAKDHTHDRVKETADLSVVTISQPQPVAK
jgi:hypothetical protein